MPVPRSVPFSHLTQYIVLSPGFSKTKYNLFKADFVKILPDNLNTNFFFLAFSSEKNLNFLIEKMEILEGNTNNLIIS